MASAQTKAWKIALHVDPNISWLKPDNNNITSEGSKLNFGYGISIDKMFTENYAIATGLNIFNTGGILNFHRVGKAIDKTNTTNEYKSVAEINRTYTLKYLEVPLTLRLRTNEIGYFTYWVQVGVGLGFNIKARADEEIDHKKIYKEGDWVEAGDQVIDYVGNEAKEGEDINDDIRLFRTSLIIGGGAEYSLSGNVSVVAGVVFNNAFSNVLRGDGVELINGEPGINADKTTKNFDMKAISNALSLQVGILF
jgi:opacity protein-like surface antigen